MMRHDMNPPTADIGEVVIERLHALVEHGYRAELGLRGSGAVSLKHPGKAPPVTLWGDGQLLDSSPTFVKNDADRIIILPEDSEGFLRFIRSTPRQTIMQKIANTTLSDSIFTTLVWILFFGFVWFSGGVLESIYKYLVGMSK
jgi:hypothetical protein